MLASNYLTFSEGFLLGIGLIVGIGPQNTLLLHQGLRRQYLHIIVVLCVLIDAGFITLGTVGLGATLTNEPVRLVATYASAALLIAYGVRSFRLACLPLSLPSTSLLPSRKQVIVTVLVVSLLNPTTYFDTLLLIGSSAAGYQGELRVLFAAGAIFASLVWFVGLSYGSALLAPILRRPRSLRVIELLSGSALLVMAFRLLQP